jgi:hypothetical protein
LRLNQHGDGNHTYLKQWIDRYTSCFCGLTADFFLGA